MYPPDPRRSHRRLAISEPFGPVSMSMMLDRLEPESTYAGVVAAIWREARASQPMPVHFVTLLRGARCQGCGTTVDLARDWLGIAWRDENGRHSCA